MMMMSFTIFFSKFSCFGNISFYLPKFNFSDRIKVLKIATMIMLRGLKAVTKTGPLVLIIIPEI